MINDRAEHINGVIYIQCENCGTSSDKERGSAFFCNSKCRSAYHNKKRKRAKDIKSAFHSLETLIGNMPLRGDSAEWDALHKMKEMIDQAIWKVES